MDAMFKWVIAVFVLMLVLVMLGEDIPSQEETQRANGYKLENCIKLANEIGIDPNDDTRSDFIKNCFEK